MKKLKPQGPGARETVKTNGPSWMVVAVIVCAVLTLVSGTALAQRLRMGYLPVIDTLPLQVGVAQGYFKAEGIDVTLVPFSSAMERNTAMQSGQLDGFFGDMPATLLMVKNKIPVRFLTVSYATNPDQRMFALMLSPQRAAKGTPAGDIQVAISKASIIEYLLDHLKGLQQTRDMALQAVEIKRMPLRVQMLLTGKIDAALLPEPLASLAQSKGAVPVVTDQVLDMPLTVLNIHTGKRDLARPFIRAYTRAVTAINQNPDTYRDLMIKNCRIPGNLAAGFPVYQYPNPRLPDKTEVENVQAWMLEKGLLHKIIPYQDLVP